jgi:HTH-type transcriptional regulator / antitoxin HigA
MPIIDKAGYDQTRAEIQRLLRKGEAQLSLEVERLLDLLSTLAENWEEAHHPIPAAPGHRILQHYLQVRGVKQAELLPVFGSRAATAAAVNGKRAISPEQAQQLGALFGVAPAVFI